MTKRFVARDDEGSALILVLAFVLIIGLIIGVIIDTAGAGLANGQVVRTETAKVYAADAAIDYGIQAIRTDDTLCADPNQGTVSLPVPPVVNGVTTTVTCTTLSGDTNDGFGYAVITRDTSNESISTSQGSTKQIDGPVFNAGGWDLQKQLQVTKGNVSEATCSTPSNLSVGPTPPYTIKCPATAPTESHALPSSIPSLAPAPTEGGGSCRVFSPGKYTTAPTLDTHNYFVSGVYYLDNVGDWAINDDVFAGQPSPGESSQNTAGGLASCWPGDPAGTNGTGVEFILGGNSQIDVQNNGQLEVYTRQPSTSDGSTAGISVYAIPSGTSGGWDASSLDPTTTAAVSVGNGTNAALSIHGFVYAPTQTVNLRATNNSGAELLGGCDVYRLALNSSASATNLAVSTKFGLGVRSIVITARTVNAAGKQITSTARIYVASSNTRQPSLQEWESSN